CPAHRQGDSDSDGQGPALPPEPHPQVRDPLSRWCRSLPAFPYARRSFIGGCGKVGCVGGGSSSGRTRGSGPRSGGSNPPPPANKFRGAFGVAFVALGRPHRLEAQDTALSRLKHGFESRWGHHLKFTRLLRILAIFEGGARRPRKSRNHPESPPGMATKWQRFGACLYNRSQALLLGDTLLQH